MALRKLFFVSLSIVSLFSCRSETEGPPGTRPPVFTCPGETLSACDLKLDGGNKQPQLEEPIVLENVVVTTATTTLSVNPMGEITLAGFFVQDQVTTELLAGRYSGILVSYVPALINTTPSIGDVVTIEGIYGEFGRDGFPKQKQANATFITVTGSGQANALDVDHRAPIEGGGDFNTMYEGVLIRVSNVKATNLSVPATSGTGNIFGFQIDGILVVSTATARYFPDQDEEFTSITGVLRLGTAPFDSGVYMLTPRTDDEFVPKNPASVVNSIVDLQDTSAPGHPAEKCTNPDGMGTQGRCAKVNFQDVVVTAVGGYVSANLRSLFIQDDRVADGRFAGVKVVYNRDSTDFVPQVGDRINVTGEGIEFFRGMQIQYANMEPSGTGVTTPTPVVVQPSAIARTESPESNPYEGVFVRLENVNVTNPCLEDGQQRDFGSWLVGGDVFVGSDFSYDYNGNRPMNANCSNGECSCASREDNNRTMNDAFQSVSGVMDYGFGDFRMQPRGNQDLVQ